MDIKTNLSRIIDIYGGNKKKQLMLELELLIHDIIESQKQLQIKQKNNVSIYANVERLIKYLIFDEWYPISTIPNDIFTEFYNIADLNHDIIFDEDRAFQYFKIVSNKNG